MLLSLRLSSACLLIAMNAFASTTALADCRLPDGTALRPVFELYTSEGCSSCPPAERWLASELDRGLAQTSVPLVFHVDYWDRLGWPDPFADPRHSARQRARVAASGGRVVYTPQFMLGEQVQWLSRDSGQLRRAVAALAATAPDLSARLLAFPDERGVAVELELQLAPDSAELQVWLLLYGDRIERRIGSGENAGRTLLQRRVVQHWQGPWPLSAAHPVRGRSRLPWPELRGRGEGIVLLLSRSPAEPAWALQLDLAECS
jgi:hypothetical protein